jgi:uncharacterized protein YkwD
VTAKAKIFFFLALCLLCVANLIAAKERSKGAAKKQGQERANSYSKRPNLMMEQAVLRYTNSERLRHKLPPLRMSAGLQFLARVQSANMCGVHTLQHESGKFPRGWRHFAGRLKIVGLTAGGENIAFRTAAHEPQVWAREVVKGWMNSAEHRKNILNPRFAYIGIGVAPCSERIVYAAQVFSPKPGRVPQTRK